MIKLLITIIFIVTSLVGGLYVVHPSYKKYQRQVKENEVLYEELESMMVYINDLKEIEKKISENEEEFQKMQNALPEDHDAPSLFLYLQDKIKENNLTTADNLGSFRVNSYKYNDIEHGRIKEIIFDLTLSGKYEDVKRFFRETEKLMRIITISSMNIGSESAPGSSLFGESIRSDKIVNINFSAKTYSY